MNVAYSWNPSYLHAHDGEDKDDDSENQAEVAECSECPSNDIDQQVQRRPWLGQLEHAQLNSETHTSIKATNYVSKGIVKLTAS